MEVEDVQSVTVSYRRDPMKGLVMAARRELSYERCFQNVLLFSDDVHLSFRVIHISYVQIYMWLYPEPS